MEFSRRTFIRGAGAIGAAAALGSQSTGAASADEDDQPASHTFSWESDSVDISFETTLDAVEDLGLDPEGDELVDDALEELDAGTLVQFPTGRYAMDSCYISTSNVGLVAAPDADPTIVPAEPRSQSTRWLLQMKTGGEYVLSGFEFDFTEEGYGGGITVYADEGDAYVGDVWIRGTIGDGANGLNVAATSSEGTVVVSRYVARDGSRYDSASHGLFVNQGHAGTLIVDDSEVWHWSDNGIYASSPGYQGSYRNATNADRGNGEVHVRGGVFKNNNIANIRVGSTNSSVRGAVVHSAASVSGDAWESREYPIMPRQGTESQPVVNGRGIWITGRESIVVEDVDIQLDMGPTSAGIAVRGEASDVTIENTRIEMNTDAPALRVPGGEDPLTVENVSFTGSSSAPAAVFHGRRESTLDDICIGLKDSRGIVGLSDERISRTDGECSVASLTSSSTEERETDLEES